MNGYRTFNKKDRVIPQDVHTLKGEEFDELRNFSNSDVGELASTIAKDKSYYIYGFRGYVKVTRPCLFCEKANNKNCACDPIYSALQAEIDDINKTAEGPLREFAIILDRKFDLRVSNSYPIHKSIHTDSLSWQQAQNLIESPLEPESNRHHIRTVPAWMYKVKGAILKEKTLPEGQEVSFDVPSEFFPHKPPLLEGDDTVVEALNDDSSSEEPDETMSKTVVTTEEKDGNEEEEEKDAPKAAVDVRKKDTNPDKRKDHDQAHNDFGPTKTNAYCYKCQDITRFQLGKCDQCLHHFKDPPTPDTAPRYAPMVPHNLAASNDHQRALHNIDTMFSRDEVIRTIDGKYSFRPTTNNDDDIIVIAHKITNSPLKYDIIDSVKLPNDNTGRTEFIINAIFETMVHNRNPKFDKYFAIPESVLNMSW